MLLLIGAGCGRTAAVTVELTPSLKVRGFTLKSWETEDSTVKIQLLTSSRARLPAANEGWFYSRYDDEGNSTGNETRLPAFNVRHGETEWFEFDVPNLDQRSKLILDIHDARFKD
jgi:hypothetical protein